MLPADACNWHKPGQRGGDLKTLAATPTFAFGDFGHQEDRLAPSGIIVGRFEAARQSPQGTLEPPPCLKPPPRRGQTFDKARLGASPIRISAHPASSQPMLRIPCFSSLKAVFSDFYPLNSRNIPGNRRDCVVHLGT